VSVEEGQVLVRHRLQGGAPKVLNQNETLRIYANQPLAKAQGQGPGVKFVLDRLKNAVADVLLNNPGGVIPGKGVGIPGAGGAQGDTGKGNKPPPTSAPPPGGGH